MSFLYDHTGRRKYLTLDERQAFLEAAANASPQVQTFCTTLAFTGARISEILALRANNFDLGAGVVVIESLKKRRCGVYRAVPVPTMILEKLDIVHRIRKSQRNPGWHRQQIWPWCRTTAWVKVKNVMAAANIHGPHASPKGLRHAFGVSAIQSGIPLNVVKRWLGHSRLSTTAIYTDVVGEEERIIARRHWAAFEGLQLIDPTSRLDFPQRRRK